MVILLPKYGLKMKGLTIFNKPKLYKMKEVKSKSYTLTNESGHWLGQIVITNDGLFASVTDYGNLSYAWRSYGDDDFRKFLSSIDIGYFGTKLFTGMSYIVHSKTVEKACKRFAEMIFPALQKALKEDIELNPDWYKQPLTPIN